MLDSSAAIMAPVGALKWRYRLPFVASGRVQGHLEDTRPSLSLGRGGVEVARVANVATARDGRGGGSRAGEGAMPEPELASAPNQGLDAQPVLAPDWGLDELVV